MQVVSDYAHSVFGPVPGQGWTRDAETYLYILRVVVNMQLASFEVTSAPGDSDISERKQQLLQSALRKWALEAREVGVASASVHFCQSSLLLLAHSAPCWDADLCVGVLNMPLCNAV